jgi:hypothetical protein
MWFPDASDTSTSSTGSLPFDTRRLPRASPRARAVTAEKLTYHKVDCTCGYRARRLSHGLTSDRPTIAQRTGSARPPVFDRLAPTATPRAACGPGGTRHDRLTPGRGPRGLAQRTVERPVRRRGTRPRRPRPSAGERHTDESTVASLHSERVEDSRVTRANRSSRTCSAGRPTDGTTRAPERDRRVRCLPRSHGRHRRVP